MPCYSPLKGYYSKSRGQSGKRSIVFTRNSGFTDLAVTVPCGKCIGCRIEKSRQWAIRCTHESKLHDRNCFLTLTYNDENLPLNQSLVKKDLQTFFKALRKKYGSFRYFASGEYGSELRPHYHIILFGLDFSSDRKKHTKNDQGDILFTSETLSKIWTAGFHLIGNFSYSSAAYVARYVVKKIGGENADDHYSRVNLCTGEWFPVLPEFALMSRRPGIGSGWYDKYKNDTFPSDFLIHDGKKHTVPRFYYDKLKKESEQTASKVKAKRKKSQIANAADCTPDRLADREICKQSQLSQLKRSL